MLKIDLTPLFNARGIRRPFTFLRRLGLSSTVAHRLTHQEGKSIRLDHIYKICDELQCTPNDILWLDSTNDLPTYHPLQLLKQGPEADLKIVDELKGVPLSKIKELKEVIDQLKK